MTKVHANNDNDILVFETQMPQDTEEQNICGLSIEKRNPNSTQKPLEIDHEHRFAKENTTNSDNEEQEGPCNKFETEENQTNKKATSDIPCTVMPKIVIRTHPCAVYCER